MSITTPTFKFLIAHPAHFIALGAGAGLARRAPGTWGTLLGFPIWWLAQHVGGNMAAWSIAVIAFVVGVWASGVTGRNLGVSDHGGIVIDEIAAFALVLCATPMDPLWWVFAFALFRLFDIWKPWPIRWFDREVKGGFGVMLDDLIAAILATAVLYLAKFAFLA